MHGQLENPCAKGMRGVGYLQPGCWRWETKESEMEMPTKKCSVCGEVKPIDQFPFNKGYTPYCKACKSAWKEARSFKKRKKNKL